MSKITYSIGVIRNHSQKVTQLLTEEKLNEVTGSESVLSIIRRIQEAGEGADIKSLKDQLPAFIFAAECSEGGKRPTLSTAVPTGKCIHDYDHLEGDVRKIYEERVAPYINVIGLQLAHITPSGKGLRLVTDMMTGESIPECQERIAKLIGLSASVDDHCKDITRISYAVSQDYILYINKEKLFTSTEREEVETASLPAVVEKGGSQNATQLSESERGSGNTTSSDIDKTDCQNGNVVSTEPVRQNTAVVSTEAYYQGIAMSKIVLGLMERMAENGKPTKGDRNTLLYKLAKELRPITHSDFIYTYQILYPFFIESDFHDSEIRSTINSAVTCTSGYTVNLSPTLQNVIDVLKAEMQMKESDSAEEKGDKYPIPELPPVFQSIIECYPERVRKAILMSLLSQFGTIGTGLRFRYIDGRMNSLSFQVCIVAESGGGKGAIIHCHEMIMNKYIKADDVSRELAEMERQERLKNQNTHEKQVRKSHPVTIIDGNITNARLMERLYEAKGRHLIIICEEISTLLHAMKGQFGDFGDVLKKAFDNGRAGKETASDNTANIYIDIFLNTLLCGTHGMMSKFFSKSNIEDGTGMRVIICELPDGLGERTPRYKSLSAKDQKHLDEFLCKLESFGLQETVVEAEGGSAIEMKKITTEIDCSALILAFEEWLEQSRHDYNETQDREWRNISFRSAVMGFRAAVLAWVAWGCPNGMQNKKEGHKYNHKMQAAIDFGIWVANYVREQQYRFLSLPMQEIRESTSLQIRTTSHREQFLSLLPMEFTPQDWQNLRQRFGQKADSNVHQTLKRLIEKHKIERCADGKSYRVVRQRAVA